MITKTKDCRTIRTGKDYTEFRKATWALQVGRCVDCGRPTRLGADPIYDDSFHLDHIDGRGMGGSRRDDTQESTSGKCGKCHRIKHGQQEAVPSRLHWSRA